MKEKKYKYLKRWELYEAGLTDAEIAGKLGYSYSAIYQWRKRNNLPSNCESKSYYSRKTLYEEGLTDERIAQILNLSYLTIQKWREKNNLPSNK